VDEVILPLILVPLIVLGLPWLIFHYITRWKTAATLTNDDEKLMEELYDLARRLDDRMCSIERIMTAENPNWRAVACDPASTGIESLGAPASQAARRIGQ
jgi:phage shock protein B